MLTRLSDTSLYTSNGHLNKVYAAYADVRPHHHAPATANELIGGKVHIYRRFYYSSLPAKKDGAILDIGCGYGEFLYFLQSEGYSNTRGIDLNARQVEVGSALGVSNLRCKDAWGVLSDSEQAFDFISAIDVLEHIPKGQVLEFLELIHTSLSPGGIFLCQVPNLAAFYTPLFYMDFSHETPFTAASLMQALQVAGFGEVVVAPMGPVIHGPKSAVRYLLWKGITAGLRFLQTVEGGPRHPLDSIYTAAIYATAKKGL